MKPDRVMDSLSARFDEGHCPSRISDYVRICLRTFAFIHRCRTAIRLTNAPRGMHEAEWQTRRMRIDTRLRSLSPAWQIIPWHEGLDTSTLICHAVTEFPTANGPADYALFVNGRFLGINEAKKVTVPPSSPARGLTRCPLVRAAPFRSAKFFSRVPNALESPANSSPKTPRTNQRPLCWRGCVPAKSRSHDYRDISLVQRFQATVLRCSGV